MALTDVTIKAAKAKDKAYTLKDIKGLSINVSSTGVKSWFFRFSWNKKMQRLTLGQYPEISLVAARNLCEQYRAYIAQGIDPREKQNQQKQADEAANANTFEKFAETWQQLKLKRLNAKKQDFKKIKKRQSTEEQIERYMRLDILPVLGKKPLKSITRADVLAVQDRLESRNALSSAEKVRGWLNEIFRVAVVKGHIETNPAADIDLLAMPYRRNKHNPFLRAEQMPDLMKNLRHFKGTRQTELGIRLLLLTGVRTGELRYAEPKEFDLDNAIWRIPAETVKQLQENLSTKDHNIPDYIVPLSHQAVAIVKELLSYHMGERYLLRHRSDPSLPISENTLNKGLHRIGFKGRLTGHGIRSTISTELNERGYNKDWVEAQLSHVSTETDRATYNHANYIEPRRKMMQDWADLLDQWESASN